MNPAAKATFRVRCCGICCQCCYPNPKLRRKKVTSGGLCDIAQKVGEQFW